ncbi:hypothetical protein VNO78_21040 [Psophocarpus tetragonolobus]|uniref:Uncharacterized protein n=1 Tax=Psophocarpus tetragonolobus TaxID=3891 RepID=A0AAN9SAX1_PSOTE
MCHDSLAFSNLMSTYQECNGKYVVKGISRPSFDFEPNASHPKSILDSVKKSLDVFFRFSRPEAMIAQAVVPHLFMNTYVVGMNQLCDLEIDKINKPNLPLISEHLSFTIEFIAWIAYRFLAIIYGSSAVLFAMGRLFNQCTLLEMEETSTTCNNVHFHYLDNYIPNFIFSSYAVLSAIAFMSFYSIGLALCKDIPDVEGDTLFGIYTLSARLGQKKGLGHGVLASILWYRTKSIDLSSKASTTSFYVFMWKLMCVEFFLMPLVR